MKLLLLFTLFFSQLYAQEQNLGKAQFMTTKDDSISFVTEELKQRAFKNIIEQEFEKMQLNAKAFWSKYNELAGAKVDLAKSKLEEKYKIGKGASISEQEKFNKEFREKKLLIERNYGSLDRVITSYVIRSNTRAGSNSDLRLMTLEAQVNRVLLNKIYHQYVHGNRTSEYGKLYINVQYELDKMSFLDLGVTNDSDFIDVVNEYWEKWFKENRPENISEIVILDSGDTSDLTAYSKIPKSKLANDIPSQFRNSLLLTINVNLKNKLIDKENHDYKFEFGGSMFLMSLQTGQVIETYNLDSTQKEFQLETSEGLSSLVANYLYRKPLAAFPVIKRRIKDLNPASKVELLRVINIKNMNQLSSLLAMIKSDLVKYSLDYSIESLTQGIASVNLVYDGQKTDLIASLKQLNSAKKGIKFEVIESDELVGIKLI